MSEHDPKDAAICVAIVAELLVLLACVGFVLCALAALAEANCYALNPRAKSTARMTA